MILNLIDSMNGREDRAIMRTKGRRIRPLRIVEPPVRTAIKTFAVAGLPAVIVIVGVVVWLLSGIRQRRIRSQFSSDSSSVETSHSSGEQEDNFDKSREEVNS